MFQWRCPGQGAAPDDLRQKGFGRGVAVKDAVFAAFFVVQHELDSDMRAARPFGVGRVRTITTHIPDITHSRLDACSGAVVAHRMLKEQGCRLKLLRTTAGAWS
jgi:hypothetical protein